MIVAELIAELEKLDPNMPVMTPGFDEGELRLATLSVRTVMRNRGLHLLSEHEISAGETNYGQKIEDAFQVAMINFQYGDGDTARAWARELVEEWVK